MRTHTSSHCSDLGSTLSLLLSSWQNFIFIQVPTPLLHKLCDLREADSYWAKPIMGILHTALPVIGSDILSAANYYSTFPW